MPTISAAVGLLTLVLSASKGDVGLTTKRRIALKVKQLSDIIKSSEDDPTTKNAMEILQKHLKDLTLRYTAMTAIKLGRTEKWRIAGSLFLVALVNFAYTLFVNWHQNSVVKYPVMMLTSFMSVIFMSVMVMNTITVRLETLKVNRDLYALLDGPAFGDFRRYPPPALRDYMLRYTVKAPSVIEEMERVRESRSASGQSPEPFISNLDAALTLIQQKYRKYPPART